MKAIVVYDTVSTAKVTGKVAEIIAETLKANGILVDSFFVEEAAKANINDYDCLIVGAPTMAWRPSKRMKAFLDGLEGGRFTGKLAATFDTQMKSSISGNATKHMEKSLMELDFSLVSPALLAYVESKDKQYRLMDGEVEKTMMWGKELAKGLLKSG